MFNDEEVVNMITEYGHVTLLNFFIYGTLSIEDANMLSIGVVPKILLTTEREIPFILQLDYLDEDDARAFNFFQGTKITFIFGGEVPCKEEIVEHIGGGVEFLRYKFEYLGEGRQESGV